MDILKVKVNGSWVPIPAITGPEGPPGPTGDPGVVQDVQVDGTSILDSQGVAEIPIANAPSKLGLVYAAGQGLQVQSDGKIVVQSSTDAEIVAGANTNKPVVPSNQHRAAFYGLAKAAGADMASSNNSVGQYTDAAKSAISTMLNAPESVSGSTPTITAKAGIQYICGEVTTLDITVPESGCFDVIFESGSTATALTITVPTGYTLEWSNDFDPSSLDADTTYEINIKTVGTKCLGVAASWT